MYALHIGKVGVHAFNRPSCTGTLLVIPSALFDLVQLVELQSCMAATLVIRCVSKYRTPLALRCVAEQQSELLPESKVFDAKWSSKIPSALRL